MTTMMATELRQETQAIEGFTVRSNEDAVARHLLRPCFSPQREKLLLAGFDRKERLIHAGTVNSGERERCACSPHHWRSLISVPSLDHVMLAHNHLSGDPRPSTQDIGFTRELAQWLGRGGIDLVDHLIFVSTGHYSFARAGLL